MASFVFTRWAWRAVQAQLDVTSLTCRGVLCMGGNTLDTVISGGRNSDNAAIFTTLKALETFDEYDGSGYATAPHSAVSGVSVAFIGTGPLGGRTRIVLGDLDYGVLGAGTSAAEGVLLYFDSDGTDTDNTNWPFAWLEFDTPTNGNGVDNFVIDFAANGSVYLEQREP